MFNVLDIYTDGSSDNRKREAGWSFCVFNGKQLIHSEGGYTDGTNNVGELKGVINGLNYVRGNYKVKQVVVHTDSKYVADTIYFDYYKWYEKDWKTKDKQGNTIDRLNKDLWVKLRNTIHLMKMRGINVEVRWVRGHRGNKGNEMADKLAVQARKNKVINERYE